MPLTIKDRVRETSATTGTGTLTLGGASVGFTTFSAAVGNGNTTYYAITDQATTANWEVGIGTYTSVGNTLARTTVLASSNAGALVNFTSGALFVFVTLPASKAIYADASGKVGINTSTASAQLDVNGSVAGSSVHGADSSLRQADSYGGATIRSSRPDTAAQHIVMVRESAYPWAIGFNSGTSDFGIGVGEVTDSNFTSPKFTLTSITFNVGINQPSPSYKLDVNGTLGASGNATFSQNVGVGVSPGGGSFLEIAAGTTSKAPIGLTSGSLLATPSVGAVEYDGNCLYFTPSASHRSVAVTEAFLCRTTTKTLSSVTTLQSLFSGTTGATNGALTVGPNETYHFECHFSLTGMSTTTGNFGFSLIGAGTATITSAHWQAIGSDVPALATVAATSGSFQSTAGQTANILVAGTGATAYALIKGVFRVSSSGTIIPSIQLTTASAAVVAVNSYFKAYSLGSDTVTCVGNWS